VKALGVTNPGFSIEMRLCEGVASIIEVNGRLGWDAGFGDMFALVTGAQPAFQTLEIALGAAPPFERKQGVHAALAYAVCYSDCVVATLPSAQSIAAAEREFDVKIGLAVHAGERMHAPPHPDSTPHLAFALAHGERSSADSYARARRAVDMLRFGLEPVTSSLAAP
jgi:biotin carboxylase